MMSSYLLAEDVRVTYWDNQRRKRALSVVFSTTARFRARWIMVSSAVKVIFLIMPPIYTKFVYMSITFKSVN